MELKQMITYILTDKQFNWISSNSEQPPQQYGERKIFCVNEKKP